MEDLYNKI
jgi:hypothetical protein